MVTLLQDVRYALRTLRKSPGFTAVALATLALGIGINTAIFSVISASLLRAMPYPHSEQLVVLWSEHAANGETRSQVSATDVADFRAMNHVFADVTTFGNYSGVLTGRGTPEVIRGVQAGDNFFGILGVQPLLGRGFLPEEQIEGRDQVLVLSYALWQTRFGGDPNIVGQTVTLSDRPYQVVGVLPKDFHPLPPTLNGAHDFYRPVAEKYDNDCRSCRHLRALARLKPGVSLAQARAEMTTIAGKLSAQYPEDKGNGVRVVPVYDDTYANVRGILTMLFAAVTAVLLVACANVANLLLARWSARRREMAIRAALGATRARMVCQVLTESLILAAGAGTAGLVLANWATAAVNLVIPRMAPQLPPVSLDLRVLGYVALVSLATALAFGLAPAIQLSSIPVNDQLNEGGRSSGGRFRSRLRSALVVGELAVALVLLVGAGLLVRSFRRLISVSPGFETSHRVSMDISLPQARYKDRAQDARFMSELARRLQTVPGVHSAGFVSTMPFVDFDRHLFYVEGRQYARGEGETCDTYMITPGYLPAMGIRLLRGRTFTETDTAESQPVALVSQSTAERLWPGQDPLGKGVALFGLGSPQQRMQRVVGVVNDVKQYSLDGASYDEIYVPMPQAPGWGGGTLVVASDRDPQGMVAEVRGQTLAMDSNLAVSDVKPLADIVGDSVLSRRVAMALASGFAVLALLLGALGIYGVIAYLVRQQTHEIGIRMALGARPADVARIVLREAGALALLGVSVGLAVALLLSRFMQALLFRVSPVDVPTFVSVPVLLVCVALLASYVPARRAARVDPMIALRTE